MITFANPPMRPSDLSPMPAELPGRGSIWRHKKGTLYRVVLLSRHTEDPDIWLVSYEPVIAEDGEVWTRAYSSVQQPEWPAFSDEGRFTHFGGPRTVKDEEPTQDEDEFKFELLHLLDDLSASAQNMLSQFGPQMKDEDVRWRRETIQKARELCDLALRGGPD